MSYQRRRFWVSGLDAQQESLIRRFIKITLPHAGANAPIAGYACGWPLYRDHALLNQQTKCYVAGNESKLDYVGQLRESSKRMKRIDESWILNPFQAWIDSRLGKDASWSPDG